MGERAHPSVSQEPYCRVASFVDDNVARFAYQWAEAVIATTECSLAAFCFLQSSYPHVAVVGVPLPEDLDHWIEGILSLGEPSSIPDRLLAQLNEPPTQPMNRGGGDPAQP